MHPAEHTHRIDVRLPPLLLGPRCSTAEPPLLRGLAPLLLPSAATSAAALLLYALLVLYTLISMTTMNTMTATMTMPSTTTAAIAPGPRMAAKESTAP
jgi:hypothetical protein